MAKLGQLLISRGWINLSQLTRALKTQSVVGGRLGTCLLEMDILTEEQLAKGLAEQLGLPGATVEQLRAVPEEVRGVLPAKVARRCHAVPFQLVGNRLDVVMLDPRNLTGHDEVAFASGRRVRVHVAPEIRIFEALERYYSEECPSRFTLLLDRLNRARYLWKEEKEREPEVTEPAPRPIPNRHGAPLGLDRFPDLPTLGPGRGRGPLLDLPVTPARTPADLFPPVRPLGSVPPPEPTRPEPKPTPPEPPRPAPPARTAAPSAPASPTPAGSTPAAPAPASAATKETKAPASPPAPTVARVISLTEEERADLARIEAPPPAVVKPTPPPLRAAAPVPAPAAASAPVTDPSATPQAPGSLDELSRALEGTTDRDDLATLMLGFLIRHFRRAALFSISRGRASGWRALGESIDPVAFAKYRVALDQPSVFLNLDRGGSLYLGPLPPMPAHRELARSWGGGLPGRVAMLPIRLGDRLVAVLYFDGEDASWAEFGIEVLNRLRTDFAAALERCIRERRNTRAGEVELPS